MQKPAHIEEMIHQLAAFATSSFDRYGRGVILAICEWDRVVNIHYIRIDELGEMLISTPDLLQSTSGAAGAYDPGRQFVVAAINVQGSGRGCWVHSWSPEGEHRLAKAVLP